jgi:hypothetical protein
MLTAELDVSGFAEIEATLAGLENLPASLTAVLLARAREGVVRLAAATPVRTRAAQQGWQALPVDATTAMIVNRVTNRGYSYPTGLITGTGSRAVPTLGFVGSHRQDWPGQFPSATLRPAWMMESTIGFSLPVSLLGGAP